VRGWAGRPCYREFFLSYPKNILHFRRVLGFCWGGGGCRVKAWLGQVRGEEERVAGDLVAV
jgi:hypothetical protein